MRQSLTSLCLDSTLNFLSVLPERSHKEGNVAQELYQNVTVLMSCYLLKIFSFRVKKFSSDTDPAAAGAAAASAVCTYGVILGGRFAPP